VIEERLARRIGLFDATMVVMGGIVGSGIFVTPATVASFSGTRAGMLAAWVVGGGAALLGAFIYADLARRRPFAGASTSFCGRRTIPLSGSSTLGAAPVIQTAGWPPAGDVRPVLQAARRRSLLRGAVAALAVAILVAVNCLGSGRVRARRAR